MSMPQTIHVILIGSEYDVVKKMGRYFRLSAPGMQPAYLCTLDKFADQKIVHPSYLPEARIDLWLALDIKAYEYSKQIHKKDLKNPRYDRGFYKDKFPDACIFIGKGKSVAQAKKSLEGWKHKIIKEWYATS